MYLEDRYSFVDDDYSERKAMYEKYIEDEMEKLKAEARQRLSLFVVPSLLDQFLSILSCSWFEGETNAHKISDDLHLEEIHFAAIDNNVSLFKEIFIDGRDYHESDNYA
jgi:hypothetical protein